MAQHLISSRRTIKRNLTLSHSTNVEVEALSRMKQTNRSEVVRAAIIVAGGSITPAELHQRKVDIAGLPCFCMSVMLGPRIAETIRARAFALNTTASAFVDACCHRYVQAWNLKPG